jgi:hypothetical protein
MLHLVTQLTGIIIRYQAPYIKNINVLNWSGGGQGEAKGKNEQSSI